jgi:hypothetical protein
MHWYRWNPFASSRAAHVLRGMALGLGALGMLALPVNVFAGPSNNATVLFGNPNAPSTAQNCVQGPPTLDACENAFHKLIPGRSRSNVVKAWTSSGLASTRSRSTNPA